MQSKRWQARGASGVDVENIDVSEILHPLQAELAFRGVAPVRCTIILDLIRVDISEQPQIARELPADGVGAPAMWWNLARRDLRLHDNWLID